MPIFVPAGCAIQVVAVPPNGAGQMASEFGCRSKVGPGAGSCEASAVGPGEGLENNVSGRVQKDRYGSWPNRPWAKSQRSRHRTRPRKTKKHFQSHSQRQGVTCSVCNFYIYSKIKNGKLDTKSSFLDANVWRARGVGRLIQSNSPQPKDPAMKFPTLVCALARSLKG